MKNEDKTAQYSKYEYTRTSGQCFILSISECVLGYKKNKFNMFSISPRFRLWLERKKNKYNKIYGRIETKKKKKDEKK